MCTSVLTFLQTNVRYGCMQTCRKVGLAQENAFLNRYFPQTRLSQLNLSLKQICRKYILNQSFLFSYQFRVNPKGFYNFIFSQLHITNFHLNVTYDYNL